jgi:lipoprotein NlpD
MKLWWMTGLIALLAGCATQDGAPVVDRAQSGAITRPAARVAASNIALGATHTVKKGDTLYGIALDAGLDYRELASWNGLGDSNVIRVGQVLRLTAPTVPAAEPISTGKPVADDAVQTAPLVSAPAVQATPIAGGAVLALPKAIKLPYSEDNLARVARGALQPPKPETPSAVSVMAPTTSFKSSESNDKAVTDDTAKTADNGGIEWLWPTQGRVLSGFNEASSSKGLDIAGKAGQPIYAAAAGKVVYSGSGLRGYGKLVIVKHNTSYLSAYAHNQQILVKEGQRVTRGQKIALMGDSDADQVKLHFEIRLMGKPVDPLKYLPEVQK